MSNYPQFSNASGETIRCSRAEGARIQEGLRLVLAANGRLADPNHVNEFLRFAAQRRINVQDLWLADEGGRLLWAMLPVVSPGRTMLLLAPAVGTDETSGTAAGQLIESVCAEFAERNIQLAQALVDPVDARTLRLYEARAFRRMAELIYLHAMVRRRSPVPALPPDFQWQCYGPSTHLLFADTIAATYRQSLDCPGLNGVRDIEDVIAGHKASGEFDPRHWMLLCEGGLPRGVLLLSRVPRTDAVELVYLGLVPEARGQGLAALMMRQALASVAAMKLPRLTLAVDSENAPALALYYGHGLERAGSKVAMMRELRGK